MKKTIITLLAALFVATGSSVAGATAIVLFDYAQKFDGAATILDSLDYSTGLGSITLKYTYPGSYYAGLFVDHEIDEPDNTFFNEYGDAVGSTKPGQSWEIDEPGWVFGDIWDNFAAKALDDSNGVPQGSNDDVSMALAWEFILLPDQIASVSFILSQDIPQAGFYLMHTDPDSQATIYFSSGLTINNSGTPVIPEPSTMILFGAGLLGLALYGRRKVTG